MTTITNGLKVIAHHGACSCGTMFISETFLHGEVVKVNAKSIRVTFSEMVRTTNGKEIERRATSETASFRFWKTVGDKTYYTGNIGARRYIITLK